MMASVLVDVSRPAATLVIVRAATVAEPPTLTVLVGVVPAKFAYVTAPIVAPLVETVAAVRE